MLLTIMICRLLSYFFFFFFSSRRRHTRFDCDWSSDVCSSDLEPERARSQSSPAMNHQLRSSRREEALASIPDRKSTRLNSSHSQISYAVFCLKKKKTTQSHTLSSKTL